MHVLCFALLFGDGYLETSSQVLTESEHVVYEQSGQDVRKLLHLDVC